MSAEQTIVNTGNILELNELKKKVGLNPKEELIETLKIVLSESQKGDGLIVTNNIDNLTSESVDRKELKVTFKIFISHCKPEVLRDALNRAFDILQADYIESLVLAYDKSESADDHLKGILDLWKVIEEFVKDGKLSMIGVSDIDTDTFIKMFEMAEVKPNILQINLEACCVVPPALNDFTRENDIQLLTHNDPCQILPKDAVHEVFGKNAVLNWVIRYQVHLKCRGVLATKGYLLGVNK